MEFSVLVDSELLFGNEILESFHIFDHSLGWLFSGLSFLGHYLGSNVFYMGLLSVVYLAFSRRLGIILGFGLLSSGIANSLLKYFFQSPRPFGVSETVANLQIAANEYAFGFPSGHVHATVVVWGILAMLVKIPLVRLFSVVLIAFMPFTRLYLGVHFLGDVLGGYFFGAINLVLVVWFVQKFENFPNPLAFDNPQRVTRTFSLITIALTLSPVVLIHSGLSEPQLHSLLTTVTSSAAFGGFIIGLMVLKLTHIHRDGYWGSFRESNMPSAGSLIVRLCVMALVIILFYFSPSLVLKKFSWGDEILVRYLRYFLVGFSIVFIMPWVLFSLQKGIYIKNRSNG